jgi:hypothetical protein
MPTQSKHIGDEFQTRKLGWSTNAKQMFAKQIDKMSNQSWMNNKLLNNKSEISADADGGPRSRVRTAGHSAQPPIDVSGNFSVHVSAE